MSAQQQITKERALVPNADNAIQTRAVQGSTGHMVKEDWGSPENAVKRHEIFRCDVIFFTGVGKMLFSGIAPP